MRKFLLAATILAPFAVGPVLAAQPQGAIIAGDLNLAQTSAGSMAGVASDQGTMAGAALRGNGAVITGTVAGNYTSVQTSAAGRASPFGSNTTTEAQQLNVGGTASAGLVMNKGWGPGTTAVTGGDQNSQATGQAAATAKNTNLGGFVLIERAAPRPTRPH